MNARAISLLELAQKMPTEEFAAVLVEAGVCDVPRSKLGRPRTDKARAVNVGMTMPPKLHRLLLTLSDQRGWTFSALVRDLIILGLDKQGITYQED